MPIPPKSTPAHEAPLVIESERAAALFAHPGRRRILFAFVGADLSLGDVAALTGESLSLLHYHVRRMVDAGLLQPRQRRARAGRAVQLYRAVASSFLVPAALMPGRPDDELQRELRAARERPSDEGYLFARAPDGRVRMRKTGGHVAELWRVLRLDEATLRELTRRIGRLLDQCEKSAGKGAKPHLVHVALARRAPR